MAEAWITGRNKQKIEWTGCRIGRNCIGWIKKIKTREVKFAGCVITIWLANKYQLWLELVNWKTKGADSDFKLKQLKY